MVSRPISIRCKLMPIYFAGINAANLLSLFLGSVPSRKSTGIQTPLHNKSVVDHYGTYMHACLCTNIVFPIPFPRRWM